GAQQLLLQLRAPQEAGFRRHSLRAVDGVVVHEAELERPRAIHTRGLRARLVEVPAMHERAVQEGAAGHELLDGGMLRLVEEARGLDEEREPEVLTDLWAREGPARQQQEPRALDGAARDDDDASPHV